jgi:hypothetical protein
MNIKTHGRKVTVIFYEKVLEPPLKQMSAPLMSSVKPNRITDLKPLDGT